MAIINETTGYFGFTIDGLDGTIDENGCVDRVIFAIMYPLRSKEVNFTISNGSEDWGAQMGDGTIIPLSQPKVLFQNRDNSIVQFTLGTRYPSNSPCNLVYRGSNAQWNATETEEKREFVPNTFAGWFGFTVEGYEGSVDANGRVNRAMFSIPFPSQSVNVTFTISNDPSHWGARMPNGDIINLRNPTVMFTNPDNAMVVFEMDSSYPSNSPCLLVYRSKDANVNIKAEYDDIFIPVDNIKDVPTEISVGDSFDLINASVEPLNASVQTIVWRVVSGYATLTGTLLTPSAAGTITLTATIKNGKGDMVDYSKSFTIKAIPAKITITKQPDSYVKVPYGEISGMLTVVATIPAGDLSYQWYSNTVNSNEGGTMLTGETRAFMNIPTSLLPGDHYYYCVISGTGGAEAVRSSVAQVRVTVAPTSIIINSKPAQLAVSLQKQLTATVYPDNADDKNVIWTSSDPRTATVNSNGVVSALAEGPVTITASTADGKWTDSCTIQVIPFVPVSRIVGVPVKAIVGQALPLTGALVEPDNASAKGITWSIVNDYGTDAILDQDSLLIPSSTGEYEACTIRATVVDGLAGGINYEQDFRIVVEYPFTPVSSIAVAKNYAKAEEKLVINAVCVPYNATRQTIIWSIEKDGGTGAAFDNSTLELVATSPGVISMQARVINGASESRDFIQTIPFTISDKQIPVSSIDGVMTTVQVRDSTPLGGSVMPVDASYQDIIWSIPDSSDNRIGATLTEDGTFYAARTGKVKVLATIKKGTFEGSDDVADDNSVDYTQEFEIEVIDFIKVNDITGIPAKIAAGSTVTLNGVVSPENATNKSISWSLVSAGSTGATLSGSKLSVKNQGTVRVKATVKNGNSISWGITSKDFTKTFDISVGESIKQVTDIEGIPESVSVGEYTLTPTVQPTDASYTEVTWSISDKGSTGATIEDGNKLKTTNTGTVKVLATIDNGLNYDVPFTKEFSIKIESGD